MFQSDPKPLHFLQKTANVLLVLTSLVFIGIGIFLFTEVKTVYLFDAILMVLGVLSLVLVFLFHCSNSSASTLNCYLYGLSGVIMFQTFISVMTVACQNRIVEWILRDHLFAEGTQKEYEENVRNKIRISAWICFSASLLQVICLFITVFFRASITRRKVRTVTRETLLSESQYVESKDAYPDEEFGDGEERRLEQMRNRLKKEYPSRNASLRIDM